MNRKGWIILLLVFHNWLFAQSQQTTLYDYQFNNQILLKDCVAQLEKEFGLHFSFPSSIGQQVIAPPAIRSTPSLETYLNQLFLPTGFEYQIVAEEKVLLRPKGEELDLIDQLLWEGIILDELSNEPVMYALLSTPDQQVYTYTDEHGQFQMSLSPQYSDVELLIHAMGYTDVRINTSQGPLPKQVKLSPTELLLTAVTVLENKPTALLSGASLEYQSNTAISTSALGGLYRNDLFKELQMAIPGIAANDDGNAGIKIRGGNDDETLIVLDEIPIYRAEHFYGIFSGINADYVDNYSVYKNANPIAYGGKLSGMVHMESGQTNNKASGRISADLLSTNGSVQLPLSKNVGLLLGGRSSYTNLTQNKTFQLAEQDKIGANGLSRQSIIVSKPSFDYYDANGKLYFDNSKLHIESNFYVSEDNYRNQYSTEYSFSSANIKLGRELFEHNTDWNNSGLNIAADYSFGKWKIKGLAYATQFETNNEIKSNLELEQSTTDRTANNGLLTDNSIQDRGQKLIFEYKPENHLFSLGLESIQHNTILRITRNETSILNRMIDDNERTAFAAWEYKPTGDLQLETGARVTNFAGSLYVLPQFQVKYFTGSKGMLKGSVSRKAQFVREITFQDRYGQYTDYLLLSNQKQLPVGLSWNYMFGGAMYLGPLTLDAELYLKQSNGVLAFSSRSLGFNQNDLSPMIQNDYKIFKGIGQSYGLDIAMQYSVKDYSTSLAYTLSKSTNSFPSIYKNESFPSANDSRHQLKWLNEYNWNRFRFFGSYVFASGRPYNDLASLTMEILIDEAQPSDLVKRLPNYNRVDAGIDYSIPFEKLTLTFGLSCFNLTNHENVKYQQYIFAVPNDNQNGKNEVLGAQTLQLDRTFNLNFALEF